MKFLNKKTGLVETVNCEEVKAQYLQFKDVYEPIKEEKTKKASSK